MKKKIFIIFTLLILIGITTTGIITINYTKNQYINEVENSFVNSAKLISFDIAKNQECDFNEKAINISDLIESRITFIKEDGTVIGDSDADISILDNHGDRPENIKALKGEIGTAVRYSDTLDIDFLYVAYPVKVDDEILIIRISKPMYKIEEFNKKLFDNYIVAILIGTIIALIFGVRFGNYIIKPINELIIGTKNIAKGNFGEKIYLNSNDELRELAENFNMMSEKLELKINETKKANLKLKSTLDSMVNGVIAIDENKNIMFVNPAAEKLLNIEEKNTIGKKLIEVFRKHEIYSKIEEYFKSQSTEHTSVKISYENNNYLIYINPVFKRVSKDDNLGIVLLIQDITEIKKLENMRENFVANVTHELKTPLTSITGFIETLKSGNITDEKTREKFLNIIEMESIRLNILIEDLLMLSEIEKKGTVYSGEINVKSSIEDVVRILISSAKENDVDIITEMEIDDDVTIECNSTWFNQLLINLIDNGIKYNIKNGKIFVRTSIYKKELVIEIEDTGIGIDTEHFDRLFERFYRVDKSRSKEVGGTGLGLAIVKHVVKILGGKIDVESEINKGTKFIVRLPLEHKPMNE